MHYGIPMCRRLSKIKDNKNHYSPIELWDLEGKPSLSSRPLIEKYHGFSPSVKVLTIKIVYEQKFCHLHEKWWRIMYIWEIFLCKGTLNFPNESS